MITTKARKLRLPHPRPVAAKPDRLGADSLTAALAGLARSIGVGDQYRPGAIEYLATQIGDGLLAVAGALDRIADVLEARD